MVSRTLSEKLLRETVEIEVPLDTGLAAGFRVALRLRLCLCFLALP